MNIAKSRGHSSLKGWVAHTGFLASWAHVQGVSAGYQLCFVQSFVRAIANTNSYLTLHNIDNLLTHPVLPAPPGREIHPSNLLERNMVCSALLCSA